MKIKNNHWLLNRPIAHRGLHDKLNPENTFLAFQKAIDKNHPIELDLQMLGDGTVVVFHDDDLARLCGENIELSDIDHNSLSKYKVLKITGIPTLAQTLDFVNNQVPLLIEIKNDSVKNQRLHDNILAVVENYTGDFAIQSFNPFTVRYFKQQLKSAPIGLLSGSLEDENLSWIKIFYLKHCIDTFICKPDFVSYQWVDMNKLMNRFNKSFRDIPHIGWTINNKEQIKKLPKVCSNYIFDPF